MEKLPMCGNSQKSFAVLSSKKPEKDIFLFEVKYDLILTIWGLCGFKNRFTVKSETSGTQFFVKNNLILIISSRNTTKYKKDELNWSKKTNRSYSSF